MIERIVYFDLETRRSADEVGGWGKADKMGLAVGCTFDALDEEFEDFQEDRVNDLISKLASADLVVGFNVIRFDYKVLSGYSMLDFKTIPTFDMLAAIHVALGFRIALGSLGQATLQVPKSADGLQSLAWFKEGEMQKIIDYCRQDVALTRDLFRHGVNEGFLRYENRFGKGVFNVSWNVGKIIERAKRRALDGGK